MMQASICPSASPFIASSCTSQTAYSSAVRVDSVAARHCAIQAWPSWTAKRVLVFPCSIASSISLTSEKDIASGDAPHNAGRGGEPQRTVAVQPLGDAGDSFARETGRAGLTKAVRLGGPGLGDGGKTQPLPQVSPALEALGQHGERLERRWWRRTPILG